MKNVISSMLTMVVLVCTVLALSAAHAWSEALEFRWEGTIVTASGEPFGLQVGDEIVAIAHYDESDTEVGPDGDGNEGIGTGGIDCGFGLCPINFGSGQGESWELRIGSVTLGPHQSTTPSFPGMIFQSDDNPENIDRLESIDGWIFRIGLNDSPAYFRVLYEYGEANCGFSDYRVYDEDNAPPRDDYQCAFEGSAGTGNTFSGQWKTFTITTRGSPTDGPPKPPVADTPLPPVMF